VISVLQIALICVNVLEGQQVIAILQIALISGPMDIVNISH
jgi:hypothetical protein